MKTRSALSLAAILTLTPALLIAWAQTRLQPARPVPTTSGPVPRPADHYDAATAPPSELAQWGVDPETFEVIGPDSAAEQIKMMNSPEQIEARYKAILAIENPEEYQRLYPKTAEMLEAERKANETFRPMSLHDFYAKATAEEQARINRAYEALFDVTNEKGMKADLDEEEPVQ